LCWVFSRIICPGWLWTLILLISVFCVARITGVSHRHLASLRYFVTAVQRNWHCLETVCHVSIWRIWRHCHVSLLAGRHFLGYRFSDWCFFFLQHWV
jgi:TRAP-type C4-dicarboxylate transport system permease large subunit